MALSGRRRHRTARSGPVRQTKTNRCLLREVVRGHAAAPPLHPARSDDESPLPLLAVGRRSADSGGPACPPFTSRRFFDSISADDYTRETGCRRKAALCAPAATIMRRACAAILLVAVLGPGRVSPRQSQPRRVLRCVTVSRPVECARCETRGLSDGETLKRWAPKRYERTHPTESDSSVGRQITAQASGQRVWPNPCGLCCLVHVGGRCAARGICASAALRMWVLRRGERVLRIKSADARSIRSTSIQTEDERLRVQPARLLFMDLAKLSPEPDSKRLMHRP